MTTTLSPIRHQGGLLDDFRSEFDRLLSSFFQPEESAQPMQWTLRVNLSETENQYEVSVDLPGMRAEDIDIELRHGDLWISGQRGGEQEQTGRTWRRVERYHGAFRRVIRLGDDVDPDQVNAEYRDGVLHITVPKSENAQTRRIEVRAQS